MDGVINEFGKETEMKSIGRSWAGMNPGKVWMGEGFEEPPRKISSETLQKADACINGERLDRYGSPEDSFARIAAYWNTYLNAGRILTAENVAMMLALMKIARTEGQKWHLDNLVDACGYLAILNDRIHKEKGE